MIAVVSNPQVVSVRTDLTNRPTEPMLVSYDARYTKLSGNCGTLRSGSGQTTPGRVGVTCGSGRSIVWVDDFREAEVTCFGTREEGDASLGLSRGEQGRLGVNH